MEWANPFSSLTIGECQCGTGPQHETVEKEIPPPINPYDILHLRRDATQSEIKKAFRRLGLLHHPGRTDVDEEQQLRKLQLFDLLAAAYETLADKEARRRYDIHLNSMQNLKYTRGLAGEMFVGGRRLGKSAHELLLAETAGAPMAKPDVVVPELVRSDSASTFSSMESGESLFDLLLTPEEETKLDGEFECLMKSNNQISVRHLPVVQVSEEEKERILGGPLRDLFEAREFAPFSDSLDIFEEVFGSKVFDSPVRRPIMQLDSWDDIKSLSSSHPGWEGSSKISADGRTRVFTTTRILHDKRITRIETFTDDPVTGTRTKSTTVTSEPIRKEAVEEEVQTCSTICGGGATLNVVEKKKSDEEPLLLERCEEEQSSSSCFCKDLLYSYYEICSQLYDDLRVMRVGYILT